MAIGTPQPTVDEMVAPQGRDIILFAEGEACIWRIDARADITGKSRREREMPLPF
jgi:hypothetical protein